MQAKTIKGTTTNDTRKALTETFEDGCKQGLAIVFISMECFLDWFLQLREFGKSKGAKHEFHNNTCSVVALKEN